MKKVGTHRLVLDQRQPIDTPTTKLELVACRRRKIRKTIFRISEQAAE
jgi:hypothetical protein